MAGSYNHCVDDQGRLLSNEHLVEMLENGGDVYEAVEEMYGMIWYLAREIEDLAAADRAGVLAPAAVMVDEARRRYVEGLAASPGIEGELEDEDE